MIETRVGDIFEQYGIDYLLHQCNLYHNFGKGIAAAIKVKYPWAYEADCKSGPKGDRLRLGTYSIGSTPKMAAGPDFMSVINAYCQDGLHATDRMTNYAAMGRILMDLNERFTREYYPGDNPTTIGIPYGFGCGLANGDWKVVEPIIYSAFEKSSKVTAIICRLPSSQK